MSHVLLKENGRAAIVVDIVQFPSSSSSSSSSSFYVDRMDGGQLLAPLLSNDPR